MRISSPPTTNPCYYGIDTPTREELIASTHSVEEIRGYIAADSLAYLSLEGLYAFTGGRRNGFCDACFTGRYPVPLDDEGHSGSCTCSKRASARTRRVSATCRYTTVSRSQAGSGSGWSMV